MDEEKESTKNVRIELVEDKYTGTLYEMEVEEECPVVKSVNEHLKEKDK